MTIATSQKELGTNTATSEANARIARTALLLATSGLTSAAAVALARCGSPDAQFRSYVLRRRAGLVSCPEHPPSVGS